MATSRLTWHLNRGVKKVLVATGKRVPGVMALMRSGLSARRRFDYARLKSANPVDSRTIVFECYAGRGYSCSPRALYRALTAEQPAADRELVWAFRGEIVAALAERGGYDIRGTEGFYTGMRFRGTLERVFGEQALEELRDAVIVPYGSREYYRTYARAGTWISNFIVPTHLVPRPGQTYLQTWHGTPLKRLGCDIPMGTSNAMFTVRDIHARYRREGERLTHFVSPSRFATERFVTAFALDELGKQDAIIEEGYPRNDVLTTFTTEQARAVRERLGLPADKRLVLYAPTWRDDQHVSGLGYTYDLGVDFEHLQDALGDEYAVLFRAHYLIANEFDFSRFEGFLYDVSDVNDINDLYIVSDILVTDYSSVFFDFANLDRPIIFHMYDLDRYADGLRGFYLKLEELPGEVVRHEPDLIAAIQAAGRQTEPDARLTAFRERFDYLDDGMASERTLARVKGLGFRLGRPASASAAGSAAPSAEQESRRTTPGDATAPDVSVIIAVHDGLPYLTEALDSVFAQDLGVERFEVIIVDDGSTDGSVDAERRFAAAHTNCVLIELSHSGSPAAPRNAGIDRARGRYLFFFDADDVLAPYALSDMVAVADANDVDIVVPKQRALGGRSVPIQAFLMTLPRTDIYEADVYRILGPVKLFRRDFVREHALRFPEGIRRKSDVPFGVQSYVRARAIAVLADRDYVHVRLRDDGGNLTVSRTALSDHMPVVRFVFDEVAKRVEPGQRRNQLMIRHFRTELAKAVLEGFATEPDDAYRRTVYADLVEITKRYCTQEVLYGLPVRERIVVHLLLEDDYDALLSVSASLAGCIRTQVVQQGGELYLEYIGFRDPALGIPDRIYQVGVRSCLQASATDARPAGSGADLDLVVRLLVTNEPVEWVRVVLRSDSGRVTVPVASFERPEVTVADVRQVEISLPAEQVSDAISECADGRWAVRVVVRVGGVELNAPVTYLESAKRTVDGLAARSGDSTRLAASNGRLYRLDRSRRGQLVAVVGSMRAVTGLAGRVYAMSRRVIKSALRRVRFVK